MTIEKYLETKGITKTDFAKIVGVCKSAMTLYCQGKRDPSLRVAVKIVEASKNKIKYKDLIVYGEI